MRQANRGLVTPDLAAITARLTVSRTEKAASMFHLWNDHIFEAIFRLPADVSLLEKILRPVLIYLFMVVLLRVFGKRELAQLNPFDLVVLLCLANTVQNASIGNDNSVIGGMIGAASLCAFNYVIVRYLFRHRRLDEILAGTPTVLIENGQMSVKGMAQEMLSEIELTTMAHRQGFASLDEVESCILEPGGTFFMQGKKPRVIELRHQEVLSEIKQLAAQITELKSIIQEMKSL